MYEFILFMILLDFFVLFFIADLTFGTDLLMLTIFVDVEIAVI